VRRAKSLDQKHFSIVVTAYWAGSGDGAPQHFCFKDVSSKYPQGFGFPEPTVDNVQLWKYGLQVGGGLGLGRGWGWAG
jgi:hypothetical protein